MLQGYAGLLAVNRRVAAVLALDPGVLEVLRANPDWNRLIGRQIALLADVEAGPAGQIRATMVMAGIAATGRPADLISEDAELPQLLDGNVAGRWVFAHPRNQPALDGATASAADTQASTTAAAAGRRRRRRSSSLTASTWCS